MNAEAKTVVAVDGSEGRGQKVPLILVGCLNGHGPVFVDLSSYANGIGEHIRRVVGQRLARGGAERGR